VRILFALPRFPLPADKGDKLRAWNQIVGLAKEHKVYVYAQTDEPIDADQLSILQSVVEDVCIVRISRPLALLRLAKAFFGKTPFQVAYFSAKKSIHRFAEYAHEVQPDLVWCQLARMALHAEGIDYQKRVLDYQDAFSKGLERRIASESFLKRILVRMEFKRMQAFERQVFEKFSIKYIISEQDAAYIQHPRRSELKILPNGVDIERYKPEPGARSIDLLFTGNMRYEPNVNCVQYLVREVLPLLNDEFPHIQLVAAGKNPAPELYKLKSAQLKLTGWIPDLRKYYSRARLFVAPMQIGIGMQNKILEAMAMGLPVITSSLANNAIGGVHGKDIWVADTPEKVAEGISYLLNNTDLAIRIGQNARDLMVEKFSWQHQNQLLMNDLSGYQIQMNATITNTKA
jgi:sugar transferase (PEP-CTERM/EpsH1 system associated)